MLKSTVTNDERVLNLLWLGPAHRRVSFDRSIQEGSDSLISLIIVVVVVVDIAGIADTVDIVDIVEYFTDMKMVVESTQIFLEAPHFARLVFHKCLN